MTRVAIAASSSIARAGLESLLRTSANLEVIASAADLSGFAGKEPDVIVADWEGGGDELSSELLDVAAGSAVILLVDDPQTSWSAEALRAGVRGVLARESSARQIVAAIEAAAAGLAVLQPEDLDGILVAPKPARLVESLTPRESEVLAMMAEGIGNKMIAFRLGISEHTVKFHVQSVMAKLNAGTRTEAVTLGIRQGLIML